MLKYIEQVTTNGVVLLHML